MNMNQATNKELLNALESDLSFPNLCAHFRLKCVKEIMDVLENKELESLVDAGFKLLVEKCLNVVSVYAESPIERIFLRAVMLAFLRNGQPLVFMPTFRNTPINLKEFRDQVKKLGEFTDWYRERFGTTYVSKEFLDIEVSSGKMQFEERDSIEELLLLYEYLPFRDVWHISPQPRFPKLLGARGTRPDMLFWKPEHSDCQLVVECDGFATHGARVHFELDRRKDRALKTLGFDVFRFTGREINSEPAMRAYELFAFLDDWTESDDA